jgi:hypothetical protein
MRQMLIEGTSGALPKREKLPAWAAYYLITNEGTYVFDDEDTARRHEGAETNQGGVHALPA